MYTDYLTDDDLCLDLRRYFALRRLVPLLCLVFYANRSFCADEIWFKLWVDLLFNCVNGIGIGRKRLDNHPDSLPRG